MKTSIIGAGKMGRWFTKFFLEEGDSVIVSDRSKEKLSKIREELQVETADNINAVKNANRILICVPIENFEDLIKEIHVHIRPDHAVMDICSIKDTPIKIMHKYIKTGITLGTHPMFGPGAKSIKDQNFILTPTNNREKMLAENFRNWLEKRGAKVFIMSPRKHDKLMSVVLGLPHFLGLVVCDTLLNYNSFLETRKISGVSYKMLLTLAEAVASEEAEFYASLQVNLPEIDKVEGLFLEKAEEWMNIVKRKDRLAFVNKVKLVKNKLAKINPEYTTSYEAMHRMLEIAKSQT
jgi:prephenate dehydrogenase